MGQKRRIRIVFSVGRIGYPAHIVMYGLPIRPTGKLLLAGALTGFLFLPKYGLLSASKNLNLNITKQQEINEAASPPPSIIRFVIFFDFFKGF